MHKNQESRKKSMPIVQSGGIQTAIWMTSFCILWHLLYLPTLDIHGLRWSLIHHMYMYQVPLTMCSRRIASDVGLTISSSGSLLFMCTYFTFCWLSESTTLSFGITYSTKSPVERTEMVLPHLVDPHRRSGTLQCQLPPSSSADIHCENNAKENIDV